MKLKDYADAAGLSTKEFVAVGSDPVYEIYYISGFSFLAAAR
jgi:hypothetical protein